MKFDYTSTPAHPRKIFKIINDFINENIYLERMVQGFPAGITVDELLERIDNNDFETIKERAIFRVKKGERNAAYNSQDPEEIDCLITLNISDIGDYGSGAVYYYAMQNYSGLRGFSRITFVLLHEVGHFMTGLEEEAGIDDRMTEKEHNALVARAFKESTNWKEFHRIFQLGHISESAEKLATNWALDFLRNAENRKKVKAFEREFFKAWRG